MSVAQSSSVLMNESTAQIKKGLRVVVAFSFCINILLLSAPIYMLQIYDRVLSSRSTDTLLFLSLMIGVAILTLALLESVRSNILVRLGVWFDKQLAGTVLAGSISLPLKNGSTPSVQGLRDLNTCRTFLSGSELFCFLDAPWAPMFLIFVFLLHPLLGYLALAGAIILFGLALINEYLTRPLLASSNKANIEALQHAESAVRNADVIEAMGMTSNLLERWDKVNAEVLELQAKASFRSSSITATSRFLRQILQISMLGVGAWLVIGGELTPGAMIAGSILMSRALAPVEQAISSWKSALSAQGAFGRLKDTFDEIPLKAESMKLPEPEGNLSVEALTYVHPGQTEAVLTNINFSLSAGQMLGVIGPSGAGKTTLIRLLLGNLTPRLGHVRLDSMDVAQWDAEDLGQYCGYVPQDIELFSGTIKDNIARMGEGDDEKVIAAAKLAGCHDMILRFPKGYDTLAGEGGLRVSGGERQRIALARALYNNPRFIVLDEPNASLDVIGEAALLNAIKSLKEKRITVVVIGHRPNIIQFVDNILVLNKGKVQDFGSKEKVLNNLSSNTPDKSINQTNSKL